LPRNGQTGNKAYIYIYIYKENHAENEGAHPASYPVVPGAISLGVKRLGREADHPPPSSAEVKE